ncbi:DUF6160 family protein [Hahella ganghwensis]|uniref:DUF6160 family protein n=1 Tax=Hahella ganghwensis TaxID=286420 RepID=UPI00036C2652|nr:DUF6160 family protein [Hahella ganghwensis]
MKGLNKSIALLAAAAVSLTAQAELKSIDDTTLADVTGQSGLVIEAGFGSISGVDAATGDFYGIDWSGAGITIDAFKWIVDIEGGWDQDTNEGVNTRLLPLQDSLVETPYAGFLAEDISIAGSVDMTIDATADLANVIGNGGAVSEGDGGIGITFANSDIHFRVGNLGVFVEDYNGLQIDGQQVSSFGGVELIGMNIDGLSLVVRGNGL